MKVGDQNRLQINNYGSRNIIFEKILSVVVHEIYDIIQIVAESNEQISIMVVI